MVASLCCVGPVVMVGLGLGSFAAASWFASWRPVFLVVTFALLGAGWFFALRRRRAVCADGACATPANRSRMSLVLLAIATAAAAGLAAYPWYARHLTAALTAPRAESSGIVAADSRTLVVRIPAMDCEACAAGIAATLRRETGVVDAEVNLASKTALIHFDPALTEHGRVLAAIAAAGFHAVIEPTLQEEVP